MQLGRDGLAVVCWMFIVIIYSSLFTMDKGKKKSMHQHSLLLRT